MGSCHRQAPPLHRQGVVLVAHQQLLIALTATPMRWQLLDMAQLRSAMCLRRTPWKGRAR